MRLNFVRLHVYDFDICTVRCREYRFVATRTMRVRQLFNVLKADLTVSNALETFVGGLAQGVRPAIT
jgi:hypothetical protein